MNTKIIQESWGKACRGEVIQEVVTSFLRGNDSYSTPPKDKQINRGSSYSRGNDNLATPPKDKQLNR